MAVVPRILEVLHQEVMKKLGVRTLAQLVRVKIEMDLNAEA